MLGCVERGLTSDAVHKLAGGATEHPDSINLWHEHTGAVEGVPGGAESRSAALGWTQQSATTLCVV